MTSHPLRSLRSGRLVALPAQVIEVPHGVIVKRGAEEVLIAGEHAREAVTLILAQAGASAHGVHVEELYARMRGVPAGVDLGGIVDSLLSRRILVDPADEPPYPERPDQILAWNLGSNPRNAAINLSSVALHVVGVNTISRRLAENLGQSGANVRVVDHPDLRNVRLFTVDEQLADGAWDLPMPEPYETWAASIPENPVTCLIACSDFGGLQLLADWNRFAYRNGWHFLPVVLQNLVGFVGPLVMPGETACFQCMLLRESSNVPASVVSRVVETHAFQGQSIAAYHPAMASVLGDVAALELTKHYSYGWTSSAIGKTIEINLMSATMQTRPILKAPGCPVCGPLELRGALGLQAQMDVGSDGSDE